MTQTIQVTINSNRQFQRELKDVLRKEYPDIEPSIFVRKAFDAFQTTTLIIEGATLLVEIIALILSIKKRHPSSRVDIESRTDKTGRTLKIDATGTDVNTKNIVRDFLRSEKE